MSFDYERSPCCNECGELATIVVPDDPDGDPKSFWCEVHGVNKIDARSVNQHAGGSR